MPIPTQELRLLSPEELVRKYGEARTMAAADLLEQVGSYEEYERNYTGPNPDPGYMNPLSIEYAKQPVQNFLGSAAQNLWSVLNLPGAAKHVWNVGPNQALQELSTSTQEKFGEEAGGVLTGLQREFATDPVGVLSNIPPFAMRGLAGTLRKTPGISKGVGNIVNWLHPVSTVSNAGKAASEMAGTILPNIPASLSGSDIGILKTATREARFGKPSAREDFRKIVFEEADAPQAQEAVSTAFERVKNKKDIDYDALKREANLEAKPVDAPDYIENVTNPLLKELREKYDIRADFLPNAKERLQFRFGTLPWSEYPNSVKMKLDRAIQIVLSGPTAPSLEHLRRAREGLDTINNEYFFDVYGRPIKGKASAVAALIRKRLDSYLKDRGGEAFRAMDVQYSTTMTFLNELKRIVDSTDDADVVARKLAKTVSEANKHAKGMVEEAEKISGVNLRAIASATDLVKSSPRTLVGRAMFAGLTFGGGAGLQWLTGNPMSAILGGLALGTLGTAATIPKYTGKAIHGLGVLSQGPVNWLGKQAQQSLSNPWTKEAILSGLWGTSQVNRARERQGK